MSAYVGSSKNLKDLKDGAQSYGGLGSTPRALRLLGELSWSRTRGVFVLWAIAIGSNMIHAQVSECNHHHRGCVRPSLVQKGNRLKAVQAPIDVCLMVREQSARCDDPQRLFGGQPPFLNYDGLQPGSVVGSWLQQFFISEVP